MTQTLSAKRARLCSVENAARIGEQQIEHAPREIAVVKTDDPLQPVKIVEGEDAVNYARIAIYWKF